VKSDQSAWGWGNNSTSQLGDGTNINRASPVSISGLSGVTGISAGQYHSLAVKADGTCWEWGVSGYAYISTH
ncbi:MAG: RCC1 domain-containing protein, partial [Firmicutes bacterium]|nr:RCC1 domain-containing protein [Bacillota bacterium]